MSACIFTCTALLLILLLRWALTRYPLLEPYTVIFTLSMPLKGTDSGTVLSCLMQAVIPFIILAVLCCLFIMKAENSGKKMFSAALSGFIVCISCFPLFLPVDGYMEAYRILKQPPVDSEFYRKYYIYPDSVKIKFPEKKKNIILIFSESMESSFGSIKNGGYMEKSCIPELEKLAADNISFSHSSGLGGGCDLFGTHWTIAAIIAKLSGIPFNLPIRDNVTFDVDFLPGAVSLTDILAKNGYSQRFLFGSDKAFASRGKYMETHSLNDVHDLLYYKKNGKIPEDYYVFWGIEDAKLFALAKEEADDMAASGKPFMLGLLTADTHFPDGYICSLCGRPADSSSAEKVKTVFRCASRQIDDYIRWIQSRPWADNTLIVVMGDHLFMNETTFPGHTKEDRKWLNVFINSSAVPSRTVNRKFSSFDMFPSILEAAGAEIQGHRLGLGRSLFSDIKTIREEIGNDMFINSELMKKTVQYNRFIYSTE